jgi:hypothetical protein
MQTAIDWLLNSLPLRFRNAILNSCQEEINQARQKEREQMIGFHKWILTMDKEANAEEFFHYMDEDMLEQYLNGDWGPGWRDLSEPLEGEPQDLAICEYSGLRPVEGYQEEIDKEIKKAIIANLDTEEGKKLVEAFRRGWLNGYKEGQGIKEDYREIEETEEYKAYRRGWLSGYDEGLYDKEVK